MEVVIAAELEDLEPASEEIGKVWISDGGWEQGKKDTTGLTVRLRSRRQATRSSVEERGGRAGR